MCTFGYWYRYGDSVRKPAAYCGVVGVKPTYGRISRYGIIPYASSLDHVGYFTTNVKDAALALEVLAGRDDHDMTSSYEEVKEYSKLLNGDLTNKTIGVFKTVMDEVKNEELKAQFNTLVSKLEEKGAKIVEVEMPKEYMELIALSIRQLRMQKQQLTIQIWMVFVLECVKKVKI